MYQLNFEKQILYDVGEAGISVDVQIIYSDATASIEAKIDTGSTACIFERIYGEQLGLKIENGSPQRFSSVNGSFAAFGHLVTITIAGFEFNPTVYFAEDENFKRNIPGRHGFLDRVVIGINDYDGKIYLSRYESE